MSGAVYYTINYYWDDRKGRVSNGRKCRVRTMMPGPIYYTRNYCGSTELGESQVDVAN